MTRLASRFSATNLIRRDRPLTREEPRDRRDIKAGEQYTRQHKSA